jgi:hypothetical protein
MPTIVQRSLVSSGGVRRPDGYPADGRGSRIIVPPGTDPETSVVLIDGELPSGWEELADPEDVLTSAPFNRPSGARDRLLAAGVPGADPGGGGDVELLFQSTWGTATGNSDNAIQDGSAWPESFWCGGNIYEVLSVVEGSGLGWSRTPNVFRTTMRGGDGEMCGAIQRQDVIPASTTHWGRLYFRWDDDEWGGAMHNYSYNFVGSIQIVYFNPQGSSSGVRLSAGLGDTYPYNSWWLKHPTGLANWIHLNLATWYRYEWMVEYITATTIRFWPRVYNMAGDLLYDSDDFYQNDHPNSGEHNLTSWYAAGNTFTKDAALMRNIGLGNEGRPGPDTGKHWYTADFAISTEGWIGDI